MCPSTVKATLAQYLGTKHQGIYLHFKRRPCPPHNCPCWIPI